MGEGNRMKEKLYKKRKDAVKNLKDEESCVFDRTKKKYVNIKMYSEFDDPFTYNRSQGALWTFLAGMIASHWGLPTALLTMIVIFVLHYYLSYKRFM